LTRFAARQLGDIVDHTFQVAPGAPIVPGQVLGWVEGFKAISDIVGAIQGQFRGPNPALEHEVTLIGDDCYDRGWLYEAVGAPDARCMDVHAYRTLLDQTIDELLDRQRDRKPGRRERTYPAMPDRP
jgi:glycine cleavage system H protein